MYDSILVPTDGSDAVERTLPHAFRLARDHDATVHALYVVDRRIVSVNSSELKTDVESELERQGADAVASVADRGEKAGVPVETAVRSGTPDREIIDYAEEVGVDVVVIGPQGKTPREKVEGLGSVSDRVANDAPMSVFLIKGEGPSED